MVAGKAARVARVAGAGVLAEPGWMPWRRFAVAQDIPAYFAQVKEISTMDFDTLVAGQGGRLAGHLHRGIAARVPQAEWDAICRDMEAAFRERDRKSVV